MGRMGVDMATIHTASFLNKKGPVFYGSLPTEYKTNGEGCKHRLVTILWGCLMAMGYPLWKSYYSNRAVFPIRVVCDQLGKPHLLLGEYQGPAVSFSECSGKVWAALCGDGSEIGIDIAGASEFRGGYPFHRVFHAQELRHASRLTLGDMEQASALLWSIKEAVVKAIGCAFHRVEPRQVYVYPSVSRGGVYTFPVGLSAKALEHLSVGAGRYLWVYSLLQTEGWLSIALWTRNSNGNALCLSQSTTCNP